MLKKCMKTLLAFLMVLSSLSLTTFAKEADGELIINDARIGSGLHQITYNGDWGDSYGYPERFYNGDEHWFAFTKYNEGDPLPYYTVDFKGTGVEVYGETQPVLGIYNIYIDGEFVKTFDAYSPERVEKIKLFTVDGLAYGEHTLKVELSNTKNEASDRCDGEFDYIKVLGFQVETMDNQKITRIEDSETTTSNELYKFQYSGEWKGESGYPNLFSNGDDHYSNKKGDYLDMHFIGSRIQFYGTKANNHSNYEVILDGETVGTANANNATKLHQQLLFDSGVLSYGHHHIRVKNPETASRAIQVDYVEVTHGPLVAESVEINESEFIGYKGMTIQATAKVLPAMASQKVIWSTSDETMATVDENGLITIQSAVSGECTLYAAAENTDLKDEAIIQILPEIDALKAYVGTTSVTANQEYYMDYIMSETTTSSWHETAWKGDELLSSIVVLTKDAVTNLKVEASDFTNGDVVFSKDNISINWLKEVTANIGRGQPNAPKKQFADVIHKGGAMDAPAQKVLTSWINIAIPEDCEPGTYTGTITVTANELEEPFVFDYSFEVLNIVQPSTLDTNTTIQIWQHPFSVAEYYGLTSAEFFNEEHCMYLRENLKEYVAMGAHDLVTNIVEEAWNHQCYYSDPSMVKWIEQEDGTFEFDYTWFDTWVKLGIETGVIDPATKMGQIKCYSIVPWGNRIGYTDKTGQYVSKSFTPGSDSWKFMWTEILTDFMAHVKEKGWFDITYISLDERSTTDLQHSIDLIHTIKDENGKSFMISSALNYSLNGDYSFTDNIDDISMHDSYVPHNNDSFREFCEHRRELGLRTTVYTCTGSYPSSYVISDPIDASYAIWYSLYQNADGYLRWAWDAWTNDPLTNVSYKSFEPGDMWFIYPTEKGEESDTYYYSSPRYEMTKQAIRDINKAKYLMSLSEDLDIEIQALIDSLKRPGKGFSYGSATYASEADRQLTISETERMRDTLLEISIDYAENGTSTTIKAELREALEVHKAAYHNSLDYTKESYELFKSTYEAAQTICNDKKAEQEAVDSIVVSLNDAAAQLVEAQEPELSNNLINTSADTDIRVIDVTSECVKGGNPDEDGVASNLLDYSNKSYWHTDYKNVIGMPQSITFDLGAVYALENLTFLPRQGAANPGRGDPIMVKLYGGTDKDNLVFLGSKAFETVDSVLANRNGFIRIYLADKPAVQYIRFEVIEAGGADGNNYANAAEMRFYGNEVDEVVVDKSVLASKLVEVEALTEEDYSIKSWSNLSAAYEAGKEVHDKAEATQEEVDAAVTEIETRLAKLVNRKPLKEVMAAADAKLAETDKYTAESLENLYSVTYGKDGANTVYNSGFAYVQADVEHHINKINEAIAALEEKPQIVAPLAVENLKAVDKAYNKVALTWEPSEGATEYDVYQKAHDSEKFELVATVSEAKYTATVKMTGKENKFYVVAKNEAGASDASKVVAKATTLHGTVKLNMKKVSTAKFELSWNKIAGATRYIIYSKRGSDEWKKVLTLGKDKLSYVTAELPNGEYSYIIRAARYDSSDRVMTAKSNAKTGTVEAIAPTVSVKVSGTKALVTWNKLEGVTYYQVLRKTSKEGKYTVIKTTSAQKYTANVSKTKTYYFKVRGYKAYKSGANSKYNVYTPYSAAKAVKGK